MRGLSLALVATFTLAAYGAAVENPTFLFPLVKEYGGIASTSGAAEPPRSGAKIVFDIVTDSKPDELNKGLESVARYLNLNADAGHQPTDVKLSLVLHGSATKAALGDAAYAKQTGATKNPNLDLIHTLKAHGVEVFVCGQSLARNKFSSTAVADDVTVAVSAMTVNANKQQAGYAYLSIH